MWIITTTTTLPNTQVQLFTNKSEAYLEYYNANYANNISSTSSWSHDNLVKTENITSFSAGILINLTNDFRDNTSPLYEETEYNIQNGITTHFTIVRYG